MVLSIKLPIIKLKIISKKRNFFNKFILKYCFPFQLVVRFLRGIIVKIYRSMEIGLKGPTLVDFILIL